MTTKLVLLRHGESAWNRENRFTGWTDVDLDSTGVKEAHLAAEELKDAGFVFDLAFTSVLKRAIRTLWISLKTGLYYVYTGNMPGDEGENTFCHHCGKKIIERIGYTIGTVNIRDGKCKFCGTPVAGVWK